MGDAQKLDVYSFGVILWVLLTAQQPWAEIPADTQELRKVVATHKRRPPLPKHCERRYADLVRACWHQQPDSRPSFEEIVVRLSSMARQLNVRMSVAASSQSARALQDAMNRASLRRKERGSTTAGGGGVVSAGAPPSPSSAARLAVASTPLVVTPEDVDVRSARRSTRGARHKPRSQSSN